MKFYIDFDGYVVVNAKNKEDAEHKFWDALPLFKEDYFSNEIFEIDGIEECGKEQEV